MSSNDIIILNRDVDALLIPSGARIFLQKGTEVTISQDLGGTFTVGIYGNLARIDGKDADALGKQAKQKPAQLPAGVEIKEYIWQQLRTCYDPEIPVNIVDLGLVYTCDVKENENGQYHVHIKMTLTAPACGMGPVLAADVKHKIYDIPTVEEVEVELVFDPPWERSMISDEAKLQLGIF